MSVYVCVFVRNSVYVDYGNTLAQGVTPTHQHLSLRINRDTLIILAEINVRWDYAYATYTYI